MLRAAALQSADPMRAFEGPMVHGAGYFFWNYHYVFHGSFVFVRF